MDQDILLRFGSVIRKLRKEKNWSQEKLAEITKFHSTYVGRVERGERNLSLRNVEIFSKAFGLDVRELFNYL